MFFQPRKACTTLAIATLVAGGIATPAFASETNDCYREVLFACADALEESSWWEKPAIGLFCTGMLAGCAFESI
jgi:hypothetical protein